MVVLSLALGIGANTALFSALNGLLLERLPVKDPDSLVRIRYSGPNDMATDSSDYGYSGTDAAGRNIRSTFSYPMYQQYVADNRTMSDLIAFAPFDRVNVVVDGAADVAEAFISTGNYYRVLGVPTVLGRTILPEDDRPDASPVAVISTKYWYSRFAGDPGIVGKTVRVNNVLVTIVGVLSPKFTGVQQAVDDPPDISIPVALDSQLQTFEPRLNRPTSWWLEVMGRLKPGFTAAQVQGNLDGVFRATARAGLEAYLAGLSDSERGTSRNRNRTQIPNLIVDSGARGVYEVSRNEMRSVTILAVVVAMVLLLVCANVANLLLSRATARRKEISVRLSLGATRMRLVRQLLTESLLLASMGGALGILVGYWGKLLLPGDAARGSSLDWRALMFVSAVTLTTGILFGIAPALRATGVNVNSALKENSRSVAGARSSLGKTLLVIQVAISLVLLVGAGLFLRTLQNLRHVDVGFNPQNVTLFRINPSLNRYDGPRAIALLTADARSALVGARGTGGLPLAAGAAHRQRQLDQHLHSGPDLRSQRPSRDQPSRRLSELLLDDGDPGAAGTRVRVRRRRGGAEGGHDQRGGREEILRRQQPHRPAVRLEPRDDEPDRDRRHRPRREIQQRPRRRAADDVRPRTARHALGEPDVRNPDRRRPGHRRQRPPRGGAADGPQPADDGRVDADRAGRAALRAGEASSRRPTRCSGCWRWSSRRSASSA